MTISPRRASPRKSRTHWAHHSIADSTPVPVHRCVLRVLKRATRAISGAAISWGRERPTPTHTYAHARTRARAHARTHTHREREMMALRVALCVSLCLRGAEAVPTLATPPAPEPTLIRRCVPLWSLYSLSLCVRASTQTRARLALSLNSRAPH